MWTIFPLLASLAVAGPPVAPVAGPRVVEVREATGRLEHVDPAPEGRGRADVPTRFARIDLALERPSGRSVDELLREWRGELRSGGEDPLADARPGSAPARFERGPGLPLGERVVSVPVLSF